jgi:hypothetical protein
VLTGLWLRASLGLAATHLCGWAAFSTEPQGYLVGTVSTVCEWSALPLSGEWRLCHVLGLLAYVRWCWSYLCAHIELFVDMPRLLPEEYKPALKGAVLGES